MLSRRKSRLQHIHKEEPPKPSNLYEWIKKEIDALGYDLSEQICVFFINSLLVQTNEFITLEMYAKPNVGIFQGIEFRPKMLLQAYNFAKRPKVYNDRRVFHPNINVESCEVVYPQLCSHWNPASSYANVDVVWEK